MYKEDINNTIKEAAEGTLKGYLEYTTEQLVSCDIIGNPASSIFDSTLTMVKDNLIKVQIWYDNEWAYSVRLVDLAEYMYNL